MDGHSGMHRRFLNKRQGLGGSLGNVFGGGSTSSSVSPGAAVPQSPPANANPLGLGGIAGGLTSLVGAAPSLLLPSLEPPPVTTSSTHSSSSTSSTTSSTSTTSLVRSTSSTTTSSSTTSSTPTSTPTPTPTPTSSDIVFTSTEGPSIIYITSTPVATPTAAASKSFLQDPSAEGPVFTLVGIVVLVVILFLITWGIRKRRRDRLDRELAAAVTFDPTVTDHYGDDRENSIEKHRLSGSSSGHGHGHVHGIQPAYAAPQQGYYGPTGYGQYPTPAPYHAPSPNPVMYQGPSPPQPAAQGGANLQRKFSDRKPVPPLLPTPAYDPTATQVSLPSPFYHY